DTVRQSQSRAALDIEDTQQPAAALVGLNLDQVGIVVAEDDALRVDVVGFVESPRGRQRRLVEIASGRFVAETLQRSRRRKTSRVQLARARSDDDAALEQAADDLLDRKSVV